MQTDIFPFTSGGYRHELIEQSGPVCLVRRSKGDRQEHFEVVVLRWGREHTWPDGRITSAGWRYPSSEQWGAYGWTYTDARMARKHYTEAQKGAIRTLAA
jgi:hypothetical protein